MTWSLDKDHMAPILFNAGPPAPLGYIHLTLKVVDKIAPETDPFGYSSLGTTQKFISSS